MGASGKSRFVMADAFKFSIVIWIAVLFIYPAGLKATNGEERLSLNGYWAFKTVHRMEEAIPLVHPRSVWKEKDSLWIPGNWDTESGYALYKGMGVYKKEIRIPPEWKNGFIRIRFGAVYEKAYVYVNGHYVGSHKGGYTPFEFRVEDLLSAGETNTIVVMADNSYARGAWWAWGGISRDVTLVRNTSVRINQLKVTPEVDLQTGKGMVNIDYGLENNGRKQEDMTVSVKVFADKEFHSVIRDTTYKVTINSETSVIKNLSLKLQGTVKLWHFDHPGLYGCEVTVRENGKIIHHKKTHFGFRKVEVRENRLLLNGEPVRLVGFNRVHDHRATGNTEPLWLIKKDLDHMKSLGCNMTRMMHAPLSPELLAYADEIGMLIIQEIPVWGRNDPQAFENNPVTRQWLQVMIGRDYNHPSVIGWSVGNELSLDIKDWKTLHMSREQYQYIVSMIKYVKKELDTGRLVTYVSHTAFREGIDINMEPARHADLICFNNYGDFVKSARTIHQRWPDKPVFITEFGQKQIGYSRDDSLDQNVTAGLAEIGKLPYIAGASLWTYNDYRSDFKGTPLGGDRTWGVVDVWRKPKRAARQIRKAFAPVSDLDVQWDDKNHTVQVRISPRAENELPTYTLSGYKLRLSLHDKTGKMLSEKETGLKDITPGDPDLTHAFSYARESPGEWIYAKVNLVSRTGHTVYDRVLYRKVPDQPKVLHTISGDTEARLYFGTALPGTDILLEFPSGETITTREQWVDVPEENLQPGTEVKIYAVNHLGRSKPLVQKIKFSGGSLPPVIRAAMQLEDGIVVGYSVRSGESRYRIQYRPLGEEKHIRERVTPLEGSVKIRVNPGEGFEVRIREEKEGVKSQWSPWKKTESPDL
ncbi:hypothetical protein ED312_00815 [Sinomicrobium pectinilyticum]|uniref:Glycoside hydrolase family 2 n=2 Tax=Sinomicrobium pectinilyticum TaxID=1084421 RepID=A0A3N0F4T1_SINP1|nr:hypothetical protein ED312_00815 [Sinomicrobium pectinilyticum]